LGGALIVALATLVAGAVPVASAQTLPAERPDSARASTAGTTDPRAVQPERPTVATHAYTVAPGYAEIEAGAQGARPSGLTQFAAPLVVKVGLAPRLQLELQGGYARSSAAAGPASAGISDLTVALKQRVVDAAPVVHDLSLQGSVKLSSGGRDVTTGTTDLSLLVISSRPIGVAELDLNAGYTHRSGDGTGIPTSATLLTASFGAPLRGPLGGVAELFAFPATSGPAGTETMVGFLIGPTWQVAPWLVLDAGAILNVRNMGGNAGYAGLTFNAGRLPVPMRGH
jgi:hypothetical protein